MKLHIFNPEHDMALASFMRGFTAPHAGRQLRADLGFLPALWAEEGDLVLVSDVEGACEKWRHIKRRPHHEVRFVTSSRLAQYASHITGVSPWGWDPALKYELVKARVPEHLLPTDQQLWEIRTMSSREWAAKCLQTGVMLADNEDWLDRMVSDLGQCVVKSPWSCSGRGVRYVTARGWRESSLRRWARKMIDIQGCVTVEPYYNKVKDFGMEFEALPSGQVEYRGLSLFHTEKGAYTGNVIATERQKESLLERYVSPAQLAEIRERVIHQLSLYINNVYTGPLGVDMMVYRCEQGLLVNPCVEVNLRRTMGHVALSLAPPVESTLRLMATHYDGSHYHLRVKETVQGAMDTENFYNL